MKLALRSTVRPIALGLVLGVVAGKLSMLGPFWLQLAIVGCLAVAIGIGMCRLKRAVKELNRSFRESLTEEQLLMLYMRERHEDLKRRLRR